MTDRPDGIADDPEDPADFLEGDCTWCDGTGEIVCNSCEGSGCKRCSDGQRTCPNCQGSGFQEDDNPGDY